MGERASLTIGIVVAMLIALCTIGFSEQVVAQSSCPNGSVAITDATRAIATAAGIPSTDSCWSPTSQNAGEAAGQAKVDLSSMTCSGSSVNITGLDGKFAVCADTFMKALRQQSPGACIRSAYRNPQQQLAACMSICGASSCPGTCAPPGYSYHQKGLAIDVNYKISNQQAWQIAGASTNNGVANPTGLHSSDPNHFQASSDSCAGAPVQQSVPTDYYSTASNSQTFFTPTNTNSQLPAGYCLVNTQPLIAAPCAPQTQLQPAPPVQSVPPSSGTTPTTVPPVVQNPSPAVATSAPALTPSPNIPQLQPITLFSSATSAAQILNTVTGAQNTVTTVWQAFTPASTSSAGEFPFGSNSYTVLGGGSPTSASGVAAATSDILAGNDAYAQETFAPNYSQDFPATATQSSSPLSQILSSLQNILTGLLSYFHSLG